MRRHIRLAAFSIATVLALLASPNYAAADGTDIAIVDDNLEVAAYRDGSGRATRSCAWASIDDTGSASDSQALGAQIQEINGVAHALFLRTCDDGTVQPVWVPLITSAALIPGARQEVERRLHYPEPIYTPFDAEAGWTYVQVPVDFRTTPETWEPIVLTAYVEGPPGLDPWITVTAQPVELWFASGDPIEPGLVAGCRGDAAIAPYVAELPGACSYTFRNASTTVAGDVFQAEMGIAWDVTYESSDGPGVLDVDPTITPAPIRVAEIKALVTCTGPDPRQGAC